MRPRLLIQIGKEVAASGGGLGQAVRFIPRDDGEVVEMVGLLLDILPRQRRGILVELAPPRLQVRTLYGLPHMRQRDLERLVANQPDRFFRVKGVPVATTARWADADRTSPRAIAIAGPEQLLCDLAQLAERYRAGGFAVRAHGELPLKRDLSLLPAGARTEHRRRSRRHATRLGALTVAAWSAVAVVSTVNLHREEIGLRDQLVALQPAADSAVALRRSVSELQSAIETASRWQEQPDEPLRILASIAGALPDEAFVSRVGMKPDGAVELEGAATQPAMVLAAMRDQAVFEAEFMRPAVDRMDVAGRGFTRFQLRLRLRHQ